jgi:hypothetical protein
MKKYHKDEQEKTEQGIRNKRQRSRRKYNGRNGQKITVKREVTEKLKITKNRRKNNEKKIKK